MMINENKLAKEVCLRVRSRAGKSKSDISIAQVKDVIQETLDLLSSGEYSMSEVVALMEKHG